MPGCGNLSRLSHGGIDPGATYQDLTEAEITYAWTLQFHWILSIIYGLETHLLFTKKESAERRQKGEKFYLSERIKRSNQVGANIFISVHVNSFKDSRAHGSEVWIHSADEKHDLELATVLAEALSYKSDPVDSTKDIKNRGIKYTGEESGEHGLYVLRKSLDIPSVLLELGFLSNKKDRAYITNPELQYAQMTRVVVAFMNWLIESEDYEYEVPLWRQFKKLGKEVIDLLIKIAETLPDLFEIVKDDKEITKENNSRKLLEKLLEK